MSENGKFPMMMAENGESSGAGSAILIQWNWITKPATERFPPVMRGSTGGFLSLSTPQVSTADQYVRRERQSERTLRSILRRAQHRRRVSGLVLGVAPKVL